ncbi:31706_t:CDS:2, partial [Racocetra persica]
NEIDNSQVIPLDINTVQTDSSDDNWETNSQVKELKKDNKFSVSRFIEEKDQETGRWRQNSDANEWNKEARIRDEMIAAWRFFMLVVHLGWNVISKSKRIDPNRLKVMPKSKWEDFIKNIKEKYLVDIDYKLIEKNLKEVEDNF